LLPKVKNWYDFESFYRIKRVLNHNIIHENEICSDFNIKGETKSNPLVNSLIEFLADKVIEKVDIEKIINDGSTAVLDIIKEIIELRLENKSSRFFDYENFLKKIQDDKLKNSILDKSQFRTARSEFYDQIPSVYTGKFVRSTESEIIGKQALIFIPDSLDCQEPFYIKFRQTKEKWYHYVSYPEVKKPSVLPDSITDPEAISLHDKKYYKNHILDDEINNIQRAIKAFCQHPEPEIIFGGTINKNRYLKEIKKTEPTKVKINNGTFFVNKKISNLSFLT
jgi:hypothetical protein